MKHHNFFTIDFGPTKEAELLLENLNNYVRLMGISRKRFYLLGAATFIANEGDNSKLVHQIADYLANAGSRFGRPKKEIT